MGKVEMAKLAQTARRVERLERELEEARADLRQAVRQAHVSGESVAELARRLNVSRTRIYQLLEDEGR